MGDKVKQPIGSFTPLYEQANVSPPLLEDGGSNIAAEMRRQFPDILGDVEFSQGPVKGFERAAAKLVDDKTGAVNPHNAEGITDLVRGRIVVETPEQITAIREFLANNADDLGIKSVKDRFAKPSNTHFRDINLTVELENGHMAEIQVNQRDMLAASDYTHDAYEERDAIEKRAALEGRDLTPDEEWRRKNLEQFTQDVHDRGAAQVPGLESLLNEDGLAKLDKDYARRTAQDPAFKPGETINTDNKFGQIIEKNPDFLQKAEINGGLGYKALRNELGITVDSLPLDTSGLEPSKIKWDAKNNTIIAASPEALESVLKQQNVPLEHYTNKGVGVEYAPDLTLKDPVQYTAPFEVSKEFNAAADSAAHMGYSFNKASSPLLNQVKEHSGVITSLVIGSGIAAYTLTAGGSQAEAAGAFYETAVPYGEAQVNLVQGNINSAAKSATVETVSNIAFGVCAVPGAVAGGTAGSAVPIVGTALGAGAGGIITGTPCAFGAGMATELVLDTAPRVGQATIDVVGFAEQKVAGGVSTLAASTMNGADNFYDYWSGNTAQMQEIYDALPVLETAANDDLYDPSNVDADPIHNYPTAHDMALIKTQIVSTQDTIQELAEGTKQPINGMNKAENTNLLQERITLLNDRFESTYDAAKADGTLDEVIDYTTQYGAFNADKASQPLVIQNTEPAANQSWDAPKVRALAM